MGVILSILFAASGAVVAGIALRAIFKIIDPARVSEYRHCKGGWWEAKLNKCEVGLLMVPQQPVNTYTNVAYLAGGLFLMFQMNILPAFIFALASLYLCAGSALYHATSTRWAGSLDVSAMYAVFSTLGIYALSTLAKLDDGLVALLMFIASVLAAYFFRYKYRGSMLAKIAIMLTITYAVLLGSRNRNHLKLFDHYLISSLILFALAFIAWNLDKAGKFPGKRWGHGVWHLLTAAAIPILFYEIHLSRWPQYDVF